MYTHTHTLYALLKSSMLTINYHPINNLATLVSSWSVLALALQHVGKTIINHPQNHHENSLYSSHSQMEILVVYDIVLPTFENIWAFPEMGVPLNHPFS